MSLDAFALDPLANSIAVFVLLIMVASAITVGAHFIQGSTTNRFFNWHKWAIPILSIIGIAVAGYLTFIEVTKSEAICGPLGDCNRVQESPFAYLFGVLPVGILGLLGYIGILMAWLVQQYGPQNLKNFSTLALWAMCWFGIAFTIYLTYLEPFVIGATCAWCITSAIIMTCLFWASSKPAILR